ncbi:MAG: 7,8-didemethyl-8-hydroxy-5-deazariboflavin synthase CofG, partial [Burkholderiales bacterium]
MNPASTPADASTASAHALCSSSGDRAIASILAEVRDGRPISRSLASQLIRAADHELPPLLDAAASVRAQFKPGVITYSRKVFLPLTNLCRDYCGYCTFRRSPGDTGAHTMTPDEVLAVASAGERLGCTEALFSLGDKPELAFPEMRVQLKKLGYKSTLHYLEGMCELVLRHTRLLPHANPGLMSREWVKRLGTFCPSLGLMLETLSTALLRPGTAHDRAPDKIPSRRLATIEAAGVEGVPFTTGLLIGIGETSEDRVDTLFAIRELHRRYGHIQEVIIQNFRAKPTIPMRDCLEPSRGEMLRTIAVARLLLKDMNIQAPPNLSAPNYEELLAAGINDWGGISPLTPDYINPEAPWPHLEDLERRTLSAGFRLVQRLPVYPEFLPVFENRSDLLGEKVRAASYAHGFAKKAA